MTTTYTYHHDAGHGWLAVSRTEITDLQLANTVTTFSYQDATHFYLEEDVDLNLFLIARQALNQPVPTFHYQYSQHSFIRNLAPVEHDLAAPLTGYIVIAPAPKQTPFTSVPPTDPLQLALQRTLPGYRVAYNHAGLSAQIWSWPLNRATWQRALTPLPANLTHYLATRADNPTAIYTERFVLPPAESL